MTLTLSRFFVLLAAALFLVASLLAFGVFSGSHMFGYAFAGLLASAVAKLV